jgi:ActR/RegA family two-component response regulator
MRYSKINNFENLRKNRRLLIASNDRRLVDVSAMFYTNLGYETRGATSAEEAFEVVKSFSPQVVLISANMSDKIPLHEIVNKIKSIEKDSNVILFARDEESDIIKEAWRSGAFFFLRQGATPQEIIPEIERAYDDYFNRLQFKYFRNFAFVLMPFSESFEDVYALGIKPAIEECGLFCERVDEQHFTDSILERILNNIEKARFIIADISGNNSNVFFEIGYAYALNKPIIFLCQDSGEKVPFDLRHRPLIIYKGKIKLLRQLLKERLLGLIEQHIGLD